MKNWGAVAAVVNDRMRELGLRQKDVAEQSGVALSTLRKIQRGDAQERSNAVLSAVARALKLPENHLRAVADGQGADIEGDEPLAVAALRDEVAQLRRRVEALEQEARTS